MRNVFFLALAILFTACGGSPEGQAVEAQDAVETDTKAVDEVMSAGLAIDTDASMITWVGAKFTGDEHKGTLKLSDGSLDVKDGKLVGGKFTIDMKSMENLDLPEDKKANLIGHLSDSDFFEVGTYPTAQFSITGVEEAAGDDGATHNITGNLSMKDITKSITFPAMVSMADGAVEASTPQFTIDRTQWNVKYGSTALGVLKDEAIDDMIGLVINIATK
ncbi:MAG: YceI family protein [Bacteroidota bacterium]